MENTTTEDHQIWKTNPNSCHFPENFDRLKTSTKTIMVYTNITFDLFKLFHVLPTCPVRIPYSKKLKKSDICSPFAGIFSVQRGTETRGVNTRTKKKKDTKRKKCIEHFLNQISILLSLGKYHVHMMLFGDNIKIAGCRTDEDAIISTMILYEDYLKPISNVVKCFSLKEGHTTPTFVFDTVMRNVDFSLGFDLDREKVNNILNLPEYKDRVYLSQFETTEQKSVNMKTFCKKPENFMYLCYYPEYNVVENIPKNPFHPDVEGNQLYNSFLIFASSKVILSGKYDDDMKESYNFFIKTIMDNKQLLQEKILPISDELKNTFVGLLGSE